MEAAFIEKAYASCFRFPKNQIFKSRFYSVLLHTKPTPHGPHPVHRMLVIGQLKASAGKHGAFAGALPYLFVLPAGPLE